MKCKLIGSFVKHLEVELSQGEEFYSERKSLVYSDDAIDCSTELIGNGFGRLLGAKIAGESLLLFRYRNISPRPAKLVVSAGSGMLHFKLVGQDLICRRGSYVASTSKVDIDTKFSISGMMGGMSMFLQRIRGNATVFLGCVGDPVVVDLQPGQTIRIDENHFLAVEGIPESRIAARWSVQNLLGGEGFSMLHVTGPGKVYLNPGTQFLRENDIR